MELQTVHHSIQDNIALIKIARAKVLNSLNSQVLNDLNQIIDWLESNPALRAAIISGEGEKAFVAGADISEMAGKSKAQALEFSKTGQRLFARLEALSIPVIAAVNGYALGGGCELAMACDFRIASINAKFGQPEVSLGIIPGYGGSQRLPRLVGLGQALFMLMSGETISAEEALRIGLVQKVVSPQELETACLEIAKKIAAKGPNAVKKVKLVARQGYGRDFESACRLEAENFSSLFGEAEAGEGLQAFLEKRKANF
jgi:enoyl-CoA hydratase